MPACQGRGISDHIYISYLHIPHFLIIHATANAWGSGFVPSDGLLRVWIEFARISWAWKKHPRKDGSVRRKCSKGGRASRLWNGECHCFLLIRSFVYLLACWFVRFPFSRTVWSCTRFAERCLPPNKNVQPCRKCSDKFTHRNPSSDNSKTFRKPQTRPNIASTIYEQDIYIMIRKRAFFDAVLMD